LRTGFERYFFDQLSPLPPVQFRLSFVGYHEGPAADAAGSYLFVTRTFEPEETAETEKWFFIDAERDLPSPQAPISCSLWLMIWATRTLI